MRTSHVGLRVADPERAVAFYTAVGYEVVGRVPETPAGQLTVLGLPRSLCDVGRRPVPPGRPSSAVREPAYGGRVTLYRQSACID
jgi:catechol 2,3-dioxygenase-like lactoylglutathione lyase family enzyme